MLRSRVNTPAPPAVTKACASTVRQSSGVPSEVDVEAELDSEAVDGLRRPVDQHHGTAVVCRHSRNGDSQPTARARQSAASHVRL